MEEIKKFLITMSLPICAVFIVLMWVSLGLKGVLTFFIAVPFVVAFAFGFTKWMEFVNKHM